MNLNRKTRIARLIALMLAAFLLLGLVLPTLAAGDDARLNTESVLIESSEDLLELAQQCRLDTWSQGKTVSLQADISLEGRPFQPIPSFGGVFEGNGYTISGLELSGSEYPAGLFGVIQQGGEIKNLTVSGDIAPSGDADTLGGIAGINYGRLIGCAFQGTVQGKNSVGGLVGINEGTGQIIGGSFEGSVSGEHYVGGVAGQNRGSLIRCENHGNVNTSEIDVDMELPDWENLNSTTNVPAGTDIGGVAGFSSGLMQSCHNSGNVGYEHTGYNVGGVVGRQSGYLDGCTNSGTVRGRKDVGGIAGQMEPQVTLKYSETSLERLWDELDTLKGLMDKMLADGENSSVSLSAAMTGVSDHVGAAKDAASDLTGAMTDYANDTVGTVNDASARLSWTLDQMGPITDDVSDALGQARDAARAFSNALEEVGGASGLGEKAMDDLRQALRAMDAAIGYGGDAFETIKKALDHLADSLGDSEQAKAALQELIDGLSDLSGSFSNISGALGQIGEALDNADEWVRNDPAWVELRDSVTELQAALTEVADALGEVLNALGQIAQSGMTPENLERLDAAVNYLSEAMTHLSQAYQHFSAALEAYNDSETLRMMQELNSGMAELGEADAAITAAQEEIQAILDSVQGSEDFPEIQEQLQAAVGRLNEAVADARAAMERVNAALGELEGSEVPEDTLATIRSELEIIRNELETVDESAGNINAALRKLTEGLTQPDLETTWAQLKAAGETLKRSSAALSQAIAHLIDASGTLDKIGAQMEKAVEHLRQASRPIDGAITGLRDAVNKLRDTVDSLAEKPAIQFKPIGSELTERGDALDNALSQVLDGVDSLNDTMTGASDILLSDLRAINRQTGVIIDLLRDGAEQSGNEDGDGYFEDISDQTNDNNQTSGHISNAKNTGVVRGDVNVAGIVGSMAIEYDFDPEDDLTESGNRTLDFRYQTLAIVMDSINEGTVTAKKNYAGGIVGRMDLGRVNACQGYGVVESTSGSYVGGIAGLSRSAVRDCFAKCTLSGERYVGGVLGSGEEDSVTTGCYTLVRIERAEQYAGAVSGSETGEFTGNYFVSDELAGLGRVSYAGKAEPIPYETMEAVDGLPEPLQRLSLRFVAEDTIIKAESFDFGASFDDEVYPEIPQKEGCYAQWDIPALVNLRFDTTVTAVYTPYITAISSEETRENGRPVLFVEGDFQKGDHLTLTAQEGGIPEGFPAGALMERWQVCIPVDGQNAHVLRYLAAGGNAESIVVYTLRDGIWQKAVAENVGSYLAFVMDGNDGQFLVLRATSYIRVWLAGVAGVVLLITICAIVRGRKKKAKLKEKRGEHDGE